MPRRHADSPLLYYIRHGETDWNREGRLQGQRDIPINANGPRAGAALRRDPARPARARAASRRTRFRLEPARTRARNDGARARDARARSAILSRRCAPDRNLVRRAGKASPSTSCASTRPTRSRRASATNGASRRPARKATPRCRSACAAGTTRSTRDTVAVAHGGVLRGLIVQLGIARAEEAPFLDIAQGVVYVIRAGQHEPLRLS